MEKEKVKRMKESGEGEVCDLCKREREDMNLKNWETHLQACKRKKKAKDEKEKTKKVSTRKRKASFGSKSLMEKFLSKKRKDSDRSDMQKDTEKSNQVIQQDDIDFEIKGKEKDTIDSIELDSDFETTELASDVEMLEVDPEVKITLENLINNISLNNLSARCQGYKPIVGNISNELSIYSLTNLDIIVENNSLHCKECINRHYALFE